MPAGVLLVLAVAAHAGDGRLEVPEPVYDAGKVDKGTAVRHSFVLKNGGTAEIAIKATPG